MRPIKPRPTTTIVSPNVGCNNLIPWRPMAPITVKAASSSVTLSGILATKFLIDYMTTKTETKNLSKPLANHSATQWTD